jgi:hypothetical protein
VLAPFDCVEMLGELGFFSGPLGCVAMPGAGVMVFAAAGVLVALGCAMLGELGFVAGALGFVAALGAPGFVAAAGSTARSGVITTGPFFAGGAATGAIFDGTTNPTFARGASSFGAVSVRAIAIDTTAGFAAGGFIGIAGRPIIVCFEPGFAPAAITAAAAASSFSGCASAAPAASSSNDGLPTSVFSSVHSLGDTSSCTARAISICSNTRALGFVMLRRPISMPGALKRLSLVVHVAVTTPSPASAGSPLARSTENAVSRPCGRGDVVAMKIALSSQKR